MLKPVNNLTPITLDLGKLGGVGGGGGEQQRIDLEQEGGRPPSFGSQDLEDALRDNRYLDQKVRLATQADVLGQMEEATRANILKFADAKLATAKKALETAQAAAKEVAKKDPTKKPPGENADRNKPAGVPPHQLNKTKPKTASPPPSKKAPIK